MNIKNIFMSVIIFTTLALGGCMYSETLDAGVNINITRHRSTGTLWIGDRHHTENYHWRSYNVRNEFIATFPFERCVVRHVYREPTNRRTSSRMVGRYYKVDAYFVEYYRHGYIDRYDIVRCHPHSHRHRW